jgi:preprotein translocase subunit SecD
MAAIEGGYSRAISTIIDSNLTTLFAALFLYIFGSGPIKGFAVTLSIGIATSLFTAVMVTRLLIIIWLERKRPRQLVL